MGARVYVVIVVLVAIALFVMLIPRFTPEREIVAAKELENYISEYLSTYRNIVAENIGLVGYNLSRFHFYLHYPKEIEGIISHSRGAAVFFNFSETETLIRIKEFSDSIEYYFWPEMARDLSKLEIVKIERAPTPYDLDSTINILAGVLLLVEPKATLIYTGEGNSFNISDKGALVIFGSLIHENKIILKGSNSKDDWSQTQAGLDATSQFIWDCRGILNTTLLEDIEAKNKVPLLLNKIGVRMTSSKYKTNQDLFYEDYEELKKFYASNETLQQVLNDFYDLQKEVDITTPRLIFNVILQYLPIIIAGILGTVVGGVILHGYIIPKIKERQRILKEPSFEIRDPRVEVYNVGSKDEFKDVFFDIKNNGKEEARGCRIKIRVKEIWDRFEILKPSFPDKTALFSVDPNDIKSIYLCKITKERPTTTVIHIEDLGKHSALTKGVYHLEIRFFGKNFVDRKSHELKLDLSSWENIGIQLAP